MKDGQFFNGMIVVAHIDNPRSGGDKIRVVGKVDEVKLTLREGNGYERQISLADVEPADLQAQKDYWFDRCMRLEGRTHTEVLADLGIDIRAWDMQEAGVKTATEVLSGFKIMHGNKERREAVRAADEAVTVTASIMRGHVLTVTRTGMGMMIDFGDHANDRDIPAGRYVYLPE